MPLYLTTTTYRDGELVSKTEEIIEPSSPKYEETRKEYFPISIPSISAPLPQGVSAETHYEREPGIWQPKPAETQTETKAIFTAYRPIAGVPQELARPPVEAVAAREYKRNIFGQLVDVTPKPQLLGPFYEPKAYGTSSLTSTLYPEPQVLIERQKQAEMSIYLERETKGLTPQAALIGFATAPLAAAAMIVESPKIISSVILDPAAFAKEQVKGIIERPAYTLGTMAGFKVITSSLALSAPKTYEVKAARSFEIIKTTEGEQYVAADIFKYRTSVKPDIPKTVDLAYQTQAVVVAADPMLTQYKFTVGILRGGALPKVTGIPEFAVSEAKGLLGLSKTKIAEGVKSGEIIGIARTAKGDIQTALAGGEKYTVTLGSKRSAFPMLSDRPSVAMGFETTKAYPIKFAEGYKIPVAAPFKGVKTPLRFEPIPKETPGRLTLYTKETTPAAVKAAAAPSVMPALRPPSQRISYGTYEIPLSVAQVPGVTGFPMMAAGSLSILKPAQYQFQGQILRQEQTQILRQEQAQGQILKEAQRQKLGQRQSLKQEMALRQTQAVGQEVLVSSIQTQRQIQIQETAQIQQLQPIIQLKPAIFRPFKPGGGKLFFSIYPPKEKERFRRGSGFILPSRSYKYAPSFTSIALGITGKKPKRRLFGGGEIRPVLKGKSRGKNKLPDWL